MNIVFNRRASLNLRSAATFLLICGVFAATGFSQSLANGNKRLRARELGIRVGTMPTGEWNAITDVEQMCPLASTF